MDVFDHHVVHITAAHDHVVDVLRPGAPSVRSCRRCVRRKFGNGEPRAKAVRHGAAVGVEVAEQDHGVCRVCGQFRQARQLPRSSPTEAYVRGDHERPVGSYGEQSLPGVVVEGFGGQLPGRAAHQEHEVLTRVFEWARCVAWCRDSWISHRVDRVVGQGVAEARQLVAAYFL